MSKKNRFENNLVTDEVFKNGKKKFASHHLKMKLGRVANIEIKGTYFTMTTVTRDTLDRITRMACRGSMLNGKKVQRDEQIKHHHRAKPDDK